MNYYYIYTDKGKAEVYLDKKDNIIKVKFLNGEIESTGVQSSLENLERDVKSMYDYKFWHLVITTPKLDLSSEGFTKKG